MFHRHWLITKRKVPYHTISSRYSKKKATLSLQISYCTPYHNNTWYLSCFFNYFKPMLSLHTLSNTHSPPVLAKPLFHLSPNIFKPPTHYTLHTSQPLTSVLESAGLIWKLLSLFAPNLPPVLSTVFLFPKFRDNKGEVLPQHCRI